MNIYKYQIKDIFIDEMVLKKVNKTIGTSVGSHYSLNGEYICSLDELDSDKVVTKMEEEPVVYLCYSEKKNEKYLDEVFKENHKALVKKQASRLEKDKERIEKMFKGILKGGK